MTKELYYKLLCNAFRITKNREDAEDVTQMTVLKLLQSGCIPDNKEAYAFTASSNTALALVKTAYRRRVGSNDDAIAAVEYEYAHKDPFARELLLKALYTLPKGQLAVMKHVLADGDIASLPGNYDTNKSHYFIAINKLKEYFKYRGPKKFADVSKIKPPAAEDV